LLKKILLALLILIVLFLIVVQFQPSQYTVTRSEVISAPPETVFSLVNDFRNWKRWSPWADLDPNMKEEHEGASSGVGAVYRWSGNDDVGKGSMRITESRPPEVIAIDLEFQEPFASRAANRFDFAPDGSGVKVNWSMSGDNDFAGKAFSLLMGGMDKAIGKDFEKGLAKLKNVAEGR
jgi:uncharacterized protein YndB with AHSA1/START domain